MTEIAKMTDSEVVAALKADTPLNRARAKFSHWWATIEQTGMQRRRPGPVEIRRMEFQAAEEILATASPSVADLQERFSRAIDYSIDLQRIIEDLCAVRDIREPATTARHHFNMAVERHNALALSPSYAALQAEVAQMREENGKLIQDRDDLIEAIQPLLGCADFARGQDLSPHETLIVTASEAYEANTVAERVLARKALEPRT